MKKKIWLSIGTIGTIAAPIAAVVSCGPEVKDGKAELEKVTIDSVAGELAQEKGLDTAGQTIKLAVRSDELTRYQTIVDKFNTLGKGTVTLVSVTSANDPGVDYAQMAATGDLPDVFIANMETMLTIKRGNWARALDINAVFGEENRSTYDVEEATKQPLVIPAGKKPIDLFDKDHISLNSNKNGVAFAFPQGFGSQGLMLNTTMLDDNVNEIHDYVPLKQRDTSITSPSNVAEQLRTVGIKELTGASHTFTRNNGESSADFVQRYIYEAGKATNTEETFTDAMPWLGSGPGSVYQRIYSAAQSLMRSEAKNLGMFALSLKDSICDYSLFASAGVQNFTNDNGVLTGARFDETLKTKSTLDKFKNYYYAAIGGYAVPGMGTRATAIMPYTYVSKGRGSAWGEHHGFHSKQSMFLYTPRWGLDYVEKRWDKKYKWNAGAGMGIPIDDNGQDAPWIRSIKPTAPTFENYGGIKSGQIATISSPYSSVTAADSWAISKTITSPAKRLLAKRLVKWLYTSTDKVYKVKVGNGFEWRATGQPTEARTIPEAMDAKISSSFAPVAAAQVAHHDVPQGYAKVGVKDDAGTSSDVYKGVGGKIWRKFDDTFWTAWTDKFFNTMDDWYDTERNKTNRWTQSEFNSTFDSAINEYFKQRGQE